MEIVDDAFTRGDLEATLKQPNGDGGAPSGVDTEAGRVGDGLFFALLVLLGLPLLIVAAGWLLPLMDGASGIGTYLVDGANVLAFCDDGLGGELAHLNSGRFASSLDSAFRPRMAVYRERLRGGSSTSVGKVLVYSLPSNRYSV